jgi:glycosyltransferase involved in cell wall biosynthesis
VKIRTFNILRLLARTFDITALCFYRSKGGALHTDVTGALRGLAPYAIVEAFPIPQEHSRVRLLLDHLTSVSTLRAYTVASYESAPFRRRLRELVATGGFELVHADSLDLSGYFPELGNLPLVCVHHDAQSRLLARRARLETAGWRRAYMGLQSRLMAREERRWCPRVTLNVTVSEVDRLALLEVAPGSRIAVVPNGVDTEGLCPDGHPERGIVFVGGTTWFPNRDALDFFARDILPELRRIGVDQPIRWVGRATAEERQTFGERYGIDLTGYVEDIRPSVLPALCYVVPLRIGGGTRIKILDAWALGKAVVSTRIGCEGLDARDGENILVRDDPREFAMAVAQVVSDPALRARLEQGARDTAERQYSWEALEPAMRAEYLALVGGLKLG